MHFKIFANDSHAVVVVEFMLVIFWIAMHVSLPVISLLLFVSLLQLCVNPTHEQALFSMNSIDATIGTLVDSGSDCADSEALLDNITAQIKSVLSNVSLDNLGVGRPGHCGGFNWTRVAYLNMTDPSHSCPGNWTQINTPIRACRRKNGGSCDVAYYSVNKRKYSEICGRIVASVVGQPEAFLSYPAQGTIDSYYLDGMDITRGSPRQHVWSFAAATSRMNNLASLCPCSNRSLAILSTVVPPFVGSNYFCDCGAPPYKAEVSGTNYINHTLWSGTDCPPSSTCCTFSKPPWFWRVLPNSTTDDIEIRQCANNIVTDENVNAIVIEVYIKP